MIDASRCSLSQKGRLMDLLGPLKGERSELGWRLRWDMPGAGATACDTPSARTIAAAKNPCTPPDDGVGACITATW